MPSIGLTTLADCKTLLNIGSGDTSKDALLTLLIGAISTEVETFLSRKLGTTDYVEQVPVNGRQLLQMLQWPINSIASIIESTVTLVPGQDYLLLPQYLASGQIYRGSGWAGPMWVRGLTADPFAGQIIITVSYNAGYVLPGDGPVTGVDPLPKDIQFCVSLMVSKAYGLSQSGNLGENLASIKEGGLAYSYDNPAKVPTDLFGIVAGMPMQFATYLTPYRRWAVA